MNHYETADGKIVVDVMKYDVAPLFPLPDGSPSTKEHAAGPPVPLDVRSRAATANTFKEEQLDDRVGRVPALRRTLLHERLPPRLDRRRATSPIRGPASRGSDGLIHYDLKTGKSAGWQRRPRRPLRRADLRAARRRRGRGRRLGAERALSRRGEARSDLAVFEATDIAKGPMALAHLSSRVPAGFHGNWRPGLRSTERRPMITVHHLNNSRSQRVLWMLEELGLDYEVKRYEREPTMQAPASLRAVHPLGKSPVITDGDKTLAESGAILEYLVETYGNGRFAPGARHAGAAPLHLLPALRRRLADAASAHEAGLQPHARARAVLRAAGRPRRSPTAPTRPCSTRRSATTSPSSRASSPSATGSPAPSSPPPTSR